MIYKFQSSLSIEPQPVSSRQHAWLNFFYKFAAFVRVRVAYDTSLLLYLLAHLLLLLQFEHCACSVAYEQQHENVYPTIALQLTTWRIKCAGNASATLGFYLYTVYTHSCLLESYMVCTYSNIYLATAQRIRVLSKDKNAICADPSTWLLHIGYHCQSVCLTECLTECLSWDLSN